ncbi:MAG: glycosyltransferase family 1 protein [bacterium]|nr:glycosyltransferase family 1 protein [bacterium]
MRVGIYAAEPYPGGEVNYIKSLIKALSLVQDLSIVLYVTSESFQYFTDITDVSIKHTKNFKLRFGGASLNKKLQRRFLIFAFQILEILNIKLFKIDDNDLDLFIFPYFAKEAIITGVPYIIIPHDKRAFENANYFNRKLNNKILREANAIVTESSYVKYDILKYVSIDNQKVEIIVSPPPKYKVGTEQENIKRIMDNYELPQKFLIYPAHIISSKNHINLILALKKIENDYGHNVNLVCTYTSDNPSHFSKVKKTIMTLGLKRNIIFYEKIPYDDLIIMYKLATALVMPTLFESVSMPIWEAFYLGCPVVSSNVCALPEQVGDAGLLFDPNNIEDMAEKIYRIWTDEKLRKKLIQKGYERIKNMTLENYAKQWEEIIEEALQIND